MAKLSKFRTDSRAIQEGEWIVVGDEYEDLEIRTRGFTDAYFDAQAARQRRAAVSLGGDVSKLPSGLRRQINIDCLIQHVVLDVRNLEDDKGQPVTAEQFHALLRDPDYSELVVACFSAAGKVGQRRQADLEDAVGNSAAASGTALPVAPTRQLG
jgi:hypothetical protein